MHSLDRKRKISRWCNFKFYSIFT